MTTIPDAGPPTFSPEEINTGAPTRSARLKWAVVVDRSLDPGRMVNAVACIAATTGALVDGLIARGGPDAAGHSHPGLPWAGCTVLAATPDQLAALRPGPSPPMGCWSSTCLPPPRSTGSTTTTSPNWPPPLPRALRCARSASSGPATGSTNSPMASHCWADHRLHRNRALQVSCGPHRDRRHVTYTAAYRATGRRSLIIAAINNPSSITKAAPEPAHVRAD